MGDRPPLPALLSHTLVAFIIDFDNEFELRQALGRVAEPFAGLPDFLPIPGYGLWSKPDTVGGNETTLPALISKVLRAFAVEFEKPVGSVARDLRECSAAHTG